MTLRNRLRLTALPLTAALLLNSCLWNRNSYDIRKYQDKATVRKEFNNSLDLTKPKTGGQAVPEDFIWIGEAEDAELTGVVNEQTGEFEGYSGRGYVGNFTGADDTVMFTVEVPVSGIYNFCFTTVSADADRLDPVEVDGQTVGTILTHKAKGFTDSRLNGIYLTEGVHRITAATDWGYYYVDRLAVTPGTPIPDEVYEVTPQLSDEKAFDNAKRLYKFLCDCYGRYTLTGQYCAAGRSGREVTLIREQTGHAPAVLGFGATETEVGLARDFYVNSGGIVTMRWNLREGVGDDIAARSLDAIADGTDQAGREALLAEIDAVCKVMEPLREAQVPVLWCPLPEVLSGVCMAESCSWLWNLLYDKMVNAHGLHNLIWVWNGTDGVRYPGDSTVDIIGADIEALPHCYSSQNTVFQKLTLLSGTAKPVALTENSVMPDPDYVQRDRAVWSWFCTKGGEYICSQDAATENYTDFSVWNAAYQSDSTLALDDLPCLWDYPLN